MKKTTFLVLICAAAMAGCSSMSKEQLAQYDEPNLPAPLAARIRHCGKLNVDDVVDLSHAGIHSGGIILYLADSGSQFSLSDDQVQSLRDEGVSGDVITYMRENPNSTGGIFGVFAP